MNPSALQILLAVATVALPSALVIWSKHQEIVYNRARMAMLEATLISAHKNLGEAHAEIIRLKAQKGRLT